MITYQHYYLENLYPFQDEIIRIVNGRTDQFYLTGGTALSRGYLNHRYSDDLDFFTNNNPAFYDSCNSALKGLCEAGYEVSFDKKVSDRFVRKVIFSKNKISPLTIQVDFINDVDAHFGNIINHPVLFRLDSLQNILSNKLCALLGRNEAKDVVDLWAICKKLDFSWADVLNEAESKDGSIDSMYISGLIQSFPEKEFNGVHWVSRPSFSIFMKDIETIAKDMNALASNSVFLKKKQKTR